MAHNVQIVAARTRCGRLPAILAVLLCVAGAAMAQQAPKRVLVLNSYHEGYRWTDNIMAGIRAEFAASDLDIELYVEYMDTKRHYADAVLPHLDALYAAKYRDIGFDAIIVSDNTALDFLLSHRETMFPKAPVLFCGINNFEDAVLAGQKEITGVGEDIDLKETIEIALRLHPGTQTVAVITDPSETGRLHLAEFRKVAPEFRDAVQFVELTDLTVSELWRQLVELPEHAVVLLLSFHRDRAGATFTVGEITALVAQRGLPIYSCWDAYLGAGIVGGVITSGEAHGRHVGRMALRVLHGESADAVPVTRESPNTPMFDYAVLSRFGISVSALPEGSLVINEPQSFYYRYKHLMWAVAAFVLVQATIIVALLAAMTQRRRAERALRRHTLELEILNQIISIGNRATSQEELFSGVLGTTLRLLDFDVGGIYLVDQGERIVELVHSERLPEGVIARAQSMSLDEEPCATVFASGEPVVTEDGAPIPPEDREALGIGSIAMVPLVAQNQVVGTISVAGTQHHAFTRKEIGILKAIGREAGSALNRVLLEEELIETNAELSRDVAHRKQAEEELARHRDHLEDLVRERTAELEAAQEELVRNERLATLGRLVAVVSHELRNPLGTIRGSLYTLGKRIQDPGIDVKRVLQRAERNILRCDTIIEDLLSYTRTPALELTLTFVDEWLAELLNEHQTPQGITVIRSLNARTAAYLDRDRFRRCVLNLITNACQAMEQDEEDEQDTRPKRLTVESRAHDGSIEIRIRDTGPGIPEAQLDKVFEPLFSTRNFGVGLGLSIVRQIMEQHEGSVRVESTVGVGTTATLCLPLDCGGT